MADVVLCPSQFLADRARKRYGIPAAKLRVVPYPMGACAPIERPRRVWTRDRSAHVGRLEPRKGLFEWPMRSPASIPTNCPRWNSWAATHRGA